MREVPRTRRRRRRRRIPVHLPRSSTPVPGAHKYHVPLDPDTGNHGPLAVLGRRGQRRLHLQGGPHWQGTCRATKGGHSNPRPASTQVPPQFLRDPGTRRSFCCRSRARKLALLDHGRQRLRKLRVLGEVSRPRPIRLRPPSRRRRPRGRAPRLHRRAPPQRPGIATGFLDEGCFSKGPTAGAKASNPDYPSQVNRARCSPRPAHSVAHGYRNQQKPTTSSPARMWSRIFGPAGTSSRLGKNNSTRCCPEKVCSRRRRPPDLRWTGVAAKPQIQTPFCRLLERFKLSPPHG